MQPPIQKIANNHQPETMNIKTPCQSYAVVGRSALHGPECHGVLISKRPLAEQTSCRADESES
jgi:hypothetical protein